MVAVVAALFVVAACGNESKSSQGQDGGTLRVRLHADVAGFDPALVFNAQNQTIAHNIFNGLVRYDEKTNEIIPDLAEKWEISPDARVFTFHLRENVQFHDGYGTLTADDVKFAIDRVLDPATGSRYRGAFSTVDDVRAVDELTVQVHLKQPNVNFIHKVAANNQGWIPSKKAVQERGEDFAVNPIGTGPFKFENWTPGESVTLLAHENYWEGKPSLDGIEFKVIPEESAARIALLNGQIDVFYYVTSAVEVEELEKNQDVVFHTRTASNTCNFVLNTTAAPTDDVRVRQAMISAIDRTSLQRDFFKGTRGPADSVLNEEFAEFTTDIPKWPYDPEKARRLLAEAGAQGAQFELVSLASAPWDQVAVILADDFKAVGLKVKINLLEPATYNDVLSKGKMPSGINCIPGPPDADLPLWQLYHTSSFPPGLNFAWYRGVDEQLQAAQSEPDESLRFGIYHEILRKVMTDVPVIPLFSQRVNLAHRPNVENFQQNSFSTARFYSVTVAR